MSGNIGMAKPQEKITKLDLRIPNELFAKIEAKAIKDGAKIHHISGKPTLSPTAIQLMEDGFKYQESGLKKEDDELKDKATTLMVEALQQITIKLAELDKRPNTTTNRTIILGKTSLGKYDPKAVSEVLENMRRTAPDLKGTRGDRKRSEGFSVDSNKQE